MSLNERPKRTGHRALAALAAVLGAAACDADRTEVVSPVGDAILDFSISSDAAEGLPGGELTIDEFALGAVEADRGDDPFGRRVDFETEEASFFTCGGPCPAFEFPARTGAEDPRLPALQDADAEVLTAITPTEVFGVPLFVGHAENLAPTTEYFVALERLATTVNGQPDALVRLLDNEDFGEFRSDPADPVDALAPLGGTIGETLGSNPYIIGSFSTDASGEAGLPNFDFDGGGDDEFLLTNEPEGFDLPRYNFLVVYEGDPRAGGVPVARAQFGIELDPSGEPILVGFAPFPTEAIGSVGDLLALECCAGRAGGITVELADLTRLSGVYQLWLTNVATGELVSPTGTLTVLEADSAGELQVVEVLDDVRSFSGDADRVYRFATDDARAGAPVGEFTHLFVSIEASETAAPSTAQPIWAEYTEVDPDDPTNAFLFDLVETAATTFGTFNLGEDPVPYIPGGFGQGAFTGEELGTADLFRARFRNLPLPPVGYFYEGYLLSDEGAEVGIGDLTTEFGEGFVSLRDVDVNPDISAQVAPGRIIESAIRATLDQVGMPFPVFDRFVLKLRPKTSVEPGPTVIVGGAVPEGIKAREETDEEG